MKTAVIIELDNPTPIAFLNACEDGDKWVKIKGCESCPEAQRLLCCGNCPSLENDGTCGLQINPENPKLISLKPLSCIIEPTPKLDDMFSPCKLQYKCVEGSPEIKNLIRRVEDKRYQLRDAENKIIEKLPAKENT